MSRTTLRAVIIGIPVPIKSPNVLVNSAKVIAFRIFPQTGRDNKKFEKNLAPFFVFEKAQSQKNMQIKKSKISHQKLLKKPDVATKICIVSARLGKDSKS